MFNKLDTNEQWLFCAAAGEQQITVVPLQYHLQRRLHERIYGY